MRSTIALVALGLALAACTPKKEDAVAASSNSDDSVAAPAAGGPVSPPADPNAPPKDGEAQITVPPSANGGANITVTWTGPGNSGDYIDLVPRGSTATTGEITYAYVRDSNGTVTLRAPTNAGEYDVRYVLDMPPARTVKVVAPLTVTAGTATLQAPAAAEAGQALEILWTGPNGPGDYVDLVKAGTTATSGEITYAYTSAGNPAKIEAPSAAGEYEIRYVLEGPGGRKVPAKSSLKVTTPKATLNAPATGEKGKEFSVEWTGPKSSGDYIDIVHKGTVATSGESDYFYVTQGSPQGLTAKEAGEYEIRYILEAPGGRVVLASRTISIR